MLGNQGPSCFRLGDDLWRIVVVSGIYYKRRMELNEFIYFYKFAGHSINILGMSLVCSYFWRIFKHNKRVVSLRNPSLKIMQSAISDVANVTRLLIKHNIRSNYVFPANMCDFMKHALENVPSLKELRIVHGTAPYSKISKSRLPYLVFPNGMGTANDVAVRNVTSLEVFEFVGNGFEYLTDAVMDFTKKNFKLQFSKIIASLSCSLRVFSVNFCGCLTDVDIRTLCTNCPKLQALRLHNLCAQVVTPQAFLLLNEKRMCDLKYLSISSFYSNEHEELKDVLSDKCLLKNINSAFPKLEYLRLGACIDITSEMTRSFSSCELPRFPELKTLSIQEPCTVECGFTNLFRTFATRRLEYLNVGGGGITNDLIFSVIEHCKTVKFISMPNANITDDSLYALKDANLKYLKLFKSAYNMNLSSKACDALARKYHIEHIVD